MGDRLKPDESPWRQRDHCKHTAGPGTIRRKGRRKQSSPFGMVCDRRNNRNADTAKQDQCHQNLHPQSGPAKYADHCDHYQSGNGQQDLAQIDLKARYLIVKPYLEKTSEEISEEFREGNSRTMSDEAVKEKLAEIDRMFKKTLEGIMKYEAET